MIDNHNTTCIIQNSKFYYCGLAWASLDSILSQMDPLCPLLPYFFIIHFSIFLPSTPGSYKWYFPFRFFIQNFRCLFHLVPAPHVSSLLVWSSRDSECALKPVQVLCSHLCLAETCFCLEEQRNCQRWPCFVLSKCNLPLAQLCSLLHWMWRQHAPPEQWLL